MGVEKIARDNYRDGMSSGALARQISRQLPKSSIVKWMLEDMLAATNFQSHDRHMVFVDFSNVDADMALEAKIASFDRINSRKVDPVPSVAP